MKLFGSDTNLGMIRKISNWFGMNFESETIAREVHVKKVLALFSDGLIEKSLVIQKLIKVLF